MAEFTWQTAVIKIGSALVSPDGTGCSIQYIQHVARFISECRKHNKHVILVSSGSVAAARGSIKTGIKVSASEKSAMAALGQTKLMTLWSTLFDFPCAQLLLTVDDLNDRQRYVNIKNTIQELLDNGVLPIVNENDTVTVERSKVGDNDNLAAHTAIAVQADCLLICTDVDGLYTGNPRTNPAATLIPVVEHINDEIMGLAGGAGSNVGTGGMITKIQAAKRATYSGIQTLLVRGNDPTTFDKLLTGDCPGTLFLPEDQGNRAKHEWIAHTSHPKGEIIIDHGAFIAMTERGASLLPAGIIEVKGTFAQEDAVLVMHEGTVIGKGISEFSSAEIQQIAGVKSHLVSRILAYDASEVVIHRDNFVLITPEKLTHFE
ncbi:glutamate 5-kinase [Agaribacter marinus]|uniref:Glutamate 5-kinase n=1 Tax=Agaribacter marinus TaxID=1431249 RepID=A0AA37T3E9_9ALTE|nr:glutamate 5-kinase [Agaribacter marinus]GLR71378.1 glutamate 5-kinase [Agaribacter marinus]